MSNQQTVKAVRISLSLPRVQTYERAVVVVGDVSPAALVLYQWNAQISGAFMAPLHICEVVIRNSVSDVLTTTYGVRWPWSPVFEASLPSPPSGYNPRSDLQTNRTRHTTTGKVIPELKFVFWQKMFTSRYDGRLWNDHLRTVLPNLDGTKTVGQLREEIYRNLEHVRVFRNRIAHHEPIFKRALANDLDIIKSLIRFRCKLTADWMMQSQRVTEHLG
jgi:hypothetical protein